MEDYSDVKGTIYIEKWYISDVDDPPDKFLGWAQGLGGMGTDVKYEKLSTIDIDDVKLWVEASDLNKYVTSIDTMDRWLSLSFNAAVSEHSIDLGLNKLVEYAKDNNLVVWGDLFLCRRSLQDFKRIRINSARVITKEVGRVEAINVSFPSGGTRTYFM